MNFTNVSISLQENPWICDCQLQALQDWLLSSQNSSGLVCHSPPRLKGLQMHNLENKELACLPVVSPTYLYLTVKETKDVSFMCRVKSNPRANISWLYNGGFISSYHRRIKVTNIDEGVLGTRSELFIINSSLSENGTYH